MVIASLHEWLPTEASPQCYQQLCRWGQATQCLLCLGYIIPEDLPMWILLPNSRGLFWWDAMIRWLAVAFFIQIPIDIAYNMQQRLPHWYYIIIQVSSMQASRSLPYVHGLRRACGMSHFSHRDVTCAVSLYSFSTDPCLASDPLN